MLLFEMPTEMIPAPSKDKAPAAWIPDETDDVVLPTAKRLSRGPETTMLDPEIPIETIPAPSKLSEPGWIIPELTEVVVLPTAYKLSPAAV